MKKIFTYLASAVLVLAASCNKMEEIDTPIDTPVDTPAETEVITVELNPDTKTALGTEGATTWSEGDEVSVTVNGENIGSLKLVERNTFSGEVKAGHKGEAILNYPASVTDVPTTQEAVAGSFANGAALLEGTTTMENLRAGEGATLQNKTALLEFSVARSGSVIFKIGDKQYTITGCETSNTYYACVDPVENAALSYTVASNQGAKSKSDASFAPGKIYPLGTLTEVFVSQAGCVYLKSGKEWQSDNAYFAAYFYNNSDENSWAKMEQVEGQLDIYECSIPDGFTNVIFCRMNPEFETLEWDKWENSVVTEDHVWNQTVNLSLLDGNLYTISNPWGIEGATTDEDKKATGNWSGEPAVEAPDVPEVETATYYMRPSSGWIQENGRYAAWCWGEDVGVWCDFIDSDSDGIFEVEIPVTCANAIFLCMSKDTNNDWANELARTSDLTLPTDDKNCYNVYTSAWTTVADAKAYDPGAIYAEDGYVYLKPNSNWTQSNAWFAIYLCNGSSSSQWIKMTKVEGTSYYGAKLPDGFDATKYKNIIFCRMNSANTSKLDWSNKWNQSGDLDCKQIVNGKNCCSINSGQWDCGTNVTWSTLTKLN